jgi:hypothetical protein
MVELRLPHAGYTDVQEAAARAREATREGERVRFLRSVFVPEDGTCFLLYEGPSARSVRAAAARARLGVRRVARTLVLGVLVALLACGSARAADDYHVTAGGDQNWGPKSGGFDQDSTTQLDHSGTMTDSGAVVGHADYHMQAGPGIARVSMDGQVSGGPGQPFNPSLQAVSATELTVDGPTAEVTTSLNLHVDGFIDTTTCADSFCGALNVHISGATGTTGRGDSEFDTLGTTRANDLGLAFDPVPGGFHVHGDVTTAQFGLTTGTPHAIGIVLNLSGRFGGHPSGETFGGTFDDPDRRLQVSYAPDGPVLNLPAGYSVSGNGVVNNRWDDPFSDDVVIDGCDDPQISTITSIPANLLLRALDCGSLSFPNLKHIGGDVLIEGDRSPHVAFPGPVLVDGSVRVVGNDGGVDLDLGGGSVGEAIDVSGTGGDLTIDTGSVGGAIDVSGTGGDLTVDTGSVGGPIDVSGTGGDLTVDTGDVGGAIDVSGTSGNLTIDTGTTGGDLDLSDNPDAGVIDVGDGQIGGDLTITDDGSAVVNANDSLTVSGDTTVETDGGGMLDLSGVDTAGDETVAADGADGVMADTAGGTTDVSILGGTAAMHVALPDGAFDQPVGFTITRGGDEPAEGGIDPIAGYEFAFAVPALHADARLSFTIDLDALDAATRAALLDAIAAGTATIAVKGDAAGSSYLAIPRCAGSQTPEANDCVTVTTTPDTARFDGIAGHFSDWAVALVAKPGGGTRPPTGGQDHPAIPARPSRAQIRASLRGQIVPHGKAARIGALLKHGYKLRFRSLVAGTVRIGWYRVRKGHKPVLVASGKRTFTAAGRATIRMKLTAAGRTALRHAKRLRLTARGAFTPTPDAAVKAARRFKLRR